MATLYQKQMEMIMIWCLLVQGRAIDKVEDQFKVLWLIYMIIWVDKPELIMVDLLMI